MLQGLRSLHERRILHRDIKPSNVFLDMAGNALLGDVGVGKELSNLTMAGRTCVGTPGAQAPEVMGLGYQHGAGADVGILLWHMLIGEEPLPQVSIDQAPHEGR